MLAGEVALSGRLRSAVRARKDLVGHRVALANQLRAHLQTCFPAGASVFADVDSDAIWDEEAAQLTHTIWDRVSPINGVPAAQVSSSSGVNWTISTSSTAKL